MSLKLLLLVVCMFACASAISRFIGWRYPLASTWTYGFTGKTALWIVFVTEVIWLCTNLFAVRILRGSWTKTTDLACVTIASVIAISIPAQVFLGHLAIRDLLTFMQDR